ncbi:chromatin associated protein [Nemania abortiva]|nr:chromatin associated protein [Nemania abortiva]
MRQQIPEPLVKRPGDWLVRFNQRVPRVLDVDLIHTLSHRGLVYCVQFSHDGKYVATGSYHSAQIYDVFSGEKICILQDDNVDATSDLYVRSVYFSPDDKYLATGSEDKLIRIWDIANRTILNTFVGHENAIYSLAFSLNGKILMSGGGDRTVRLWDIETSINILTLTLEDSVTSVAFSPDTNYIAASWNLLWRLGGPDGHEDNIYSIALSPTGELVSGSLDKTIKMWELSLSPLSIAGDTAQNEGRCIKTFKGHKDYVRSVAFTPDANWVISGSTDQDVQFWDARTGESQLTLKGHTATLISVAASPTGQLFATGSGDRTARIWSYGAPAQ